MVRNIKQMKYELSMKMWRFTVACGSINEKKYKWSGYDRDELMNINYIKKKIEGQLIDEKSFKEMEEFNLLKSIVRIVNEMKMNMNYWSINLENYEQTDLDFMILENTFKEYQEDLTLIKKICFV